MSSVAKELDDNSTHQFLQLMPVYAHWLAVQMLKVYESAKRQLSDKATSLEFRIAYKSFVIDTDLVRKTSKAIHAVCAMEMSVSSPDMVC